MQQRQPSEIPPIIKKSASDDPDWQMTDPVLVQKTSGDYAIGFMFGDTKDKMTWRTHEGDKEVSIDVARWWLLPQ